MSIGSGLLAQGTNIAVAVVLMSQQRMVIHTGNQQKQHLILAKVISVKRGGLRVTTRFAGVCLAQTSATPPPPLLATAQPVSGRRSTMPALATSL